MLTTSREAWIAPNELSDGGSTASASSSTGMSPYCPLNADKAVVALNNQGVSLLARGYFPEAVAAFQDAITIMRSITTAAGHATIIASKGLCHEQINAMLQSAMHQTAVCGAASCGSVEEDTMPKLHVISSQHCPSRVYKALTSCKSSAELSVAFPMTIDRVGGSDDDEDNSDENVAFESSTLLYNCGLAYECVAATTRCEAASFLVRSCSHRILQMVAAVLGQARDEMGVGHGNLGTAASKHLLLQTVLAHTRIDISIKLDRHDEYETCCEEMEHYLQMVEYQQHFLPLNNEALAAAA